MTKLMLMKTATGALVPADAETAEYLAKLKAGAGVGGDFKRQRNIRFHKKVFSLFKLAFDAWDAPEVSYRGQQVHKEFDRFRKDLTVLAGHYEAVTNLRGEVRLEAKSLNFANMDDVEFEKVYKSILTVIWEKVLRDCGYGSVADIDRVIQQLERYE